MQDIYLTIIVPVYNVERYLRMCLDSIAQLKAFSWEAILVDDGSTDTSDKSVISMQNRIPDSELFIRRMLV